MEYTALSARGERPGSSAADSKDGGDGHEEEGVWDSRAEAKKAHAERLAALRRVRGARVLSVAMLTYSLRHSPAQLVFYQYAVNYW